MTTRTRRKARRFGLRGALLLLVISAGISSTGAVGASTAPFVRVRVVHLVDHSRRAHFRDGTSAPRRLPTYVRYPTRGHAPFPLIVFAHGFALRPSVYARLLDAWARAGYMVAAPVFPVERPSAPGGPDQSDLLNEPADMTFVVSRLTSPAGPLRGLVDTKRIVLAGHSDGAVAALAAAYDRRFRESRIDAAMILSGAAPPGFTSAPAGSPPLLAVQGTLDPINAPSVTADYYRLMRRPKFMLSLLGASHLPPYTTDDRWAVVVERATTAFLDHYLRGVPLRRLIAAAGKAGVARLAYRR